MPEVTVATFNVENLFARFKFRGKKVKKGKYRNWTKAELAKIAKDGWLADKTFFDVAKPKQRTLTAGVIKAAKADVVALQEIENLDTLRKFNTRYLKSKKYRHHLLIDSHDPRFINVAVFSKYPIGAIRTHQFTRSAKSYIFSRDCLELDLELDGGVTLPILINHFKSMMGGRAKTAQRRLDQAEEVLRILKARFGAGLAGNFVVLGDLNDYADPAEPSPAIDALLNALVNVNDRIGDPDARWTHYWAKGKEYRQLDYILLSPDLAAANAAAAPTIIRSGMPRRATKYTGKRLKGVGENQPKASDHCPVAITLSVQ